VNGLPHAGLGALLFAFLGGILSFFSPCVAPLVPGYISFLSGAALREDGAAGRQDAEAVLHPPRVRAGTSSPQKERGQGGRSLRLVRASMVAPVAGDGMLALVADRAIALPRRLSVASIVSLLFVCGFSLTFVVVGTLAGSFGQVLAAYRPVMQTLAGIVMVAMGAFLLQWLPRGWMEWLSREGRLHPLAGTLRGWGLAGPVLFGVVFAAGWTPCIGPVLAAILSLAGASGSALSGTALLAVYSLGFAVPFLAVGLGWSAGVKALGWAKRHGGVISTVSGMVLILVGLLYLTGKVSIFSTWAGQITLP
jgi:cytochrome c-type biogenesis protein